LGRQTLDQSIDLVALLDHRGDDSARQLGRHRVAFGLCEVALQDGRCGPLTEFGLEDCRQRRPAPGPQRTDPIAARDVR
jgi:hypothetical protein